jgi:hypothetical protein
MSVVLSRKLFNGNKPSSKNNGIVSGFDDDNNDSELQQLIDERKKVYQDILPAPTEVSRLGAASPALLALGSALLSGRSLQGGIPGALEILGQGVGASAPLFGEALRTRRAAEQANIQRQFDIDLAAVKSAEDILATRAAAAAKATPGDIKSVFYLNPNFDENSPVSDQNPRYIQSVRQMGSDNQLRIKDATPNSATFGEFVLEDQFSGYTTSDPRKLVTPSSGDVWIKNPAYDPNAEGAKESDMFLLTKFKKDKFNNVRILDNRDGSKTKGDYVLENNFGEYSFTEPKSMIEAEGEKLDKANLYGLVQTEFDKMNKIMNKKTRKLSDKELAAIIMRAGDDPGEWEKFSTQFGSSFFELGEILQDYQTPDPALSIEFTGTDDAGNTEEVVTTGTETEVGYRDHIDERYDLNKSDPNYDIKRQAAIKNYNQLETFPPNVVESVISAFDGFKDLKMMADNYDVGIPYGGWIIGITSKLGLNPRATEFLTGKNGTLVTSTSALIKGIPSDFDVQNLLNTLPSEGEGDAVNFARIKRLERVYSDIIKNYLSFYGGINYRVPPQVEIIAREMIGNEAVDEALSTEYSQQKLNDLRSLNKEEYIAKYGDVFQSSINILGLPDGDFMGAELSDAEKEELENFEKKLKGN